MSKIKELKAELEKQGLTDFTVIQLKSECAKVHFLSRQFFFSFYPFFC